jgi:hypothetical protein
MPFKVLLLVLIFAVPIVPTFWALLDIPKRRFATPRKKMLWFFLVATLPFLGAVFYIIVARRHTEATGIL